MSVSTTPATGPDRAGRPAFETIPVGEGPHSVAASRDGLRVYVTNFLDGTVSVIDATSNTVATTFPVATGPYGVAVDLGGKRLYVAENSSTFVKVYDTDTGTIALDSGMNARPYGLALTEHPELLLIANAIDNQVMVSDLLTKPLGTLTGIDFPVGIAADANQFYASNYFEGTITVHDAANLTLHVKGPTPAQPQAVITVPRGPYGVAVDRHSERLYVAHFPFDTVSVIDLDSRSVARTITVPGGPRGVAVSPDGTRLYVTNFFERTLTVVPL
ncbi:YncE family protein [Kitasatospora sp. NPDC093806]|uniref:YncE family protein n=1 Tax=Kitasatospora sp. NPDC093806 TaxID=3155075 RepID=UPI003422773E